MNLRLASCSTSLARNMSTRSTRSRAIATSLSAPSSTALATSPSIPLKREASSPPPSSSTPKKARSTPSKKVTSKLSTTPSKGKTSTPKKFAAYLTTPFPDYARPTADECEEVTRLLGAMHGLPQRPGMVEKLPEDGTTRVGEACGAVPSVLDALIRTILSQNTTNANSARAYASLLSVFGHSKSNKRAVDLVSIYKAQVADIQDSIRCGGLANVKGKVISNVLQSVYDRNTKLAQASTVGHKEDINPIKKELDAVSPSVVKTEDVKSEGAVKKEEVSRVSLSPPPPLLSRETEEEDLARLLSLDYVHSMSDDEAMKELESFPGVGPKTASCVLLFCLERDSFAVDTHVFRLSKSLGWVPFKANRETTYEHLDVRIPSHLKYPLHVLLIAHGKSCPRCAAVKGKTSRPTLGPCPLVGLTKKAKEEGGGEGNVEEVVGDMAAEVEKVVGLDVETALRKAHGA